METVRGFALLDRSEIRRFDLRETLHTVLDALSPSWSETTHLKCELDSAAVIEGDAQRITAALATVIRNATEALDGPGEVIIIMTTQGDLAEICVRDTGRGMSQAQLDALFVVDFGATSRVRARFGLAVCQATLRRHGGEITVASEIDKGKEVKMTFPLA